MLKPTSSSLSLVGLRPTYLSLSLLSLYIHTLACRGHIEPSSFGFTVILLSRNFLSPIWYQSEKPLRVPATPPPLASPAAPPPSAPAPPPSVFGLRFIAVAFLSLSRRQRVVVAFFFVAFGFLFFVCAFACCCVVRRISDSSSQIDICSVVVVGSLRRASLLVVGSLLRPGCRRRGRVAVVVTARSRRGSRQLLRRVVVASVCGLPIWLVRPASALRPDLTVPPSP